MKDVFNEFLSTLLKELKANRPSTPFYCDEDGEIDDDRYQEALEAQWDRADSGIDEQIEEVEELLDEDVDLDCAKFWYQRVLKVLNKHNYKVIITKIQPKEG